MQVALDGYSSYVYLPGDGENYFYFDVSGTGYMDELDAVFIEIHESTDGANRDWVDTFNHDNTSGMLSYNDNFHSDYVSFDGVAGCYYKVWAGKDSSSDSCCCWTSA